MIVVGLDPDSNKHGVAVYLYGRLIELLNLDLPNLRKWISDTRMEHKILFSIEDVACQSFVYKRNEQDNKRLQGKVGVGIGRCQQAQIEVMRELDSSGIKYVLHKPQSGNWAENKNMFERATGWKGKSNKETRSAAYFGMLEARRRLLSD